MQSWSLALVLLFLSAPLRGQIYADVATTLGDFSLELDYENAPRTVANFITLAEGSKAWLDSADGTVHTNTPYYKGIKFHRVIADFMSQTGSQNGLGTDGPGYNFPDEVDNGLTFDARHLLAMANSGANTNGSQFFITDVATPHLNGLHTIFGSVATGGAVVDAINNAPVQGSSPVTDILINSITIRRVGAAAEAFDEFAQLLPNVEPVAMEILSVTNGTPLIRLLQPPSSTLRFTNSIDLASWSFPDRFLGPTETADSEFTFGNSSLRFFRPSLTRWPADLLPPPDFSSATLSLNANYPTEAITSPIILSFNQANNSLTLTVPNRTPSTTLLTNITQESDAYGTRISGNAMNYLVSADSLSLIYAINIRLGYHGTPATTLEGHHTGTLLQAKRQSTATNFLTHDNFNISLKNSFTLTNP